MYLNDMTFWDWAIRVNVIGGIVTAIPIVLGSFLFAKRNRQAKKRTLDQIDAHLNVIKGWARGAQGDGWFEHQVSLHQLVVWSDPRNTILQVGSSGPLTNVAIVQGLFNATSGGLFSGSTLIKNKDVINKIVQLAQAITSMNAYLDKIKSLQTANPVLSAGLSEKLDRFVHNEMLLLSVSTLNDVYTVATLSPDERKLASYLASMSRTLHLTLIGNIQSLGVYRALKDLEALLDKERAHS